MTPMHVAAKNGKADFIKAVIAAISENAQFDARDDKGNTVYHYAATANKETIEVNISGTFTDCGIFATKFFIVLGFSFLCSRWNDQF